MTRAASCSCGQLKVSCDGDPVRVSICHCLACQQRTGSAFGVQARYPREHVRVEGSATIYQRLGDSGGRASFHFCAVCGATVYWELDGLPDHIAVAVGAFADSGFPPPTVAVYEARQHPFVPTLDVEHHD
jgi:hypothetical protein